jgi:hypothetical protein
MKMGDDKKHTTLPAGEGESYLVFSDIITVKATPADTDGRYFVVEALSPPGSGPPSCIPTRPSKLSTRWKAFTKSTAATMMENTLSRPRRARLSWSLGEYHTASRISATRPAALS